MSMMTSQITSFTIVYSIVYLSVYQRKHQSSASLAFVQGIHRWPVNSQHKGPVMQKMFPFDDVIMNIGVSGSPTMTHTARQVYVCHMFYPIHEYSNWHKAVSMIYKVIKCSFIKYHSCLENNTIAFRHLTADIYPDSKVHGANMGPIWDRQDPGGPHVGHMNFAIWDIHSEHDSSA